MPKIKACIFDLDGVIVDTAKYHFLAWKRLTEMLGFSLSQEDNENLKGISREDSLEIILKMNRLTLPKEEKAILLNKKNSWYLNYIHQINQDELLPGVKLFIEELRNKKIKIALGSMSRNAVTILDRIKIINYFDAIIDNSKISKAKPDPEIFLKGAEMLGILPSNCVVFEDAQAGIEAAIRANMYVVGVGNLNILRRSHTVINSFEKLNFEKLLKLLK